MSPARRQAAAAVPPQGSAHPLGGLAPGGLAHHGLWLASGLCLAWLSVAVISGVFWAAARLLAVLLGV